MKYATGGYIEDDVNLYSGFIDNESWIKVVDGWSVSDFEWNTRTRYLFNTHSQQRSYDLTVLFHIPTKLYLVYLHTELSE